MQILKSTIDFDFYRQDSTEKIHVAPGTYLLPDRLSWAMFKSYPFHLERTDANLYADYARRRDKFSPYGFPRRILIIAIAGIGDTLFVLPTARRLVELGHRVSLAIPRDIIPIVHRTNYNGFITPFETLEYSRALESDCIVTLEDFTLEATKYDLLEHVAEFVGLNNGNMNFRPMLNAMKDHCPVTPGDRNLVIQYSSSSPIRSLPPSTILEFINLLDDKDNIWIVDRPGKADEIDREIVSKANKPVINFARMSKSPSDLVGLIAGSQFVLSPDSSSVHISAAFDVPCLAYYSPFPSSIRTTHYPFVLPLDIVDDCDYRDRSGTIPPGCFQHGPNPCLLAQERGKTYSPCWDKLTAQQLFDKYKEARKIWDH